MKTALKIGFVLIIIAMICGLLFSGRKRIYGNDERMMTSTEIAELLDTLQSIDKKLLHVCRSTTHYDENR